MSCTWPHYDVMMSQTLAWSCHSVRPRRFSCTFCNFSVFLLLDGTTQICKRTLCWLLCIHWIASFGVPSNVLNSHSVVRGYMLCLWIFPFLHCMGL